jgi:hypothetical protein
MPSRLRSETITTGTMPKKTGDGALPTTITAAKIAPGDREEELKEADNRCLGTFLYENDVDNGPLLTIPMQYRAK